MFPRNKVRLLVYLKHAMNNVISASNYAPYRLSELGKSLKKIVHINLAKESAAKVFFTSLFYCKKIIFTDTYVLKNLPI